MVKIVTVTITHPDVDGEAHVPASTLALWESKGWSVDPLAPSPVRHPQVRKPSAPRRRAKPRTGETIPKEGKS